MRGTGRINPFDGLQSRKRKMRRSSAIRSITSSRIGLTARVSRPRRKPIATATAYGSWAGTADPPYIGSQSVLADILKPPYPLSIQRLIASVMMASSSLIR
jgi:hypothetical protein